MSEDRVAGAIAALRRPRDPDRTFADELFRRFVDGVGEEGLRNAVRADHTDDARWVRAPRHRAPWRPVAVAALLIVVAGSVVIIRSQAGDEGTTLATGTSAGVPFRALVALEETPSRGGVVEVFYESPAVWRIETVEPSAEHGAGTYLVSDGKFTLEYESSETPPNQPAPPPNTYVRRPWRDFNTWDVGINGAVAYIEPAAWDRECAAVEVLPDERIAGRPTRHFRCQGPMSPRDLERGRGVSDGEYWTDLETGLVLKQIVNVAEGNVDEGESVVKVREVIEIDYDVDFDGETFSTDPPAGAIDEADVPPPPSTSDSGRPMPPDPPSTVLVVGQPAPEWTAALVGGGEASVHDYLGQPLVVLFWATWCPEACTGAGALGAFAEQSTRTGVAFLSVATLSPIEDVRAAVVERGYQFPVALDPDGAIVEDVWGVQAFPTWVFLRADGTVAGIHGGQLPNLATVLDALVAGEPLPSPLEE